MQFTNKMYFFFLLKQVKGTEKSVRYVLAEVMCIIKIHIYLFCIDRLSIICADFHYSAMIQ